MPKRPNPALARHVGSQLRQLRAAKGWTQFQLSSRSGVLESSISRIERQKLLPGLDTAVALADALGVSLCDLVEASRPTPVILTDGEARALEAFRRLKPTDRNAILDLFLGA